MSSIYSGNLLWNLYIVNPLCYCSVLLICRGNLSLKNSQKTSHSKSWASYGVSFISGKSDQSFTIVQSSAVITRSNLSWWHCDNRSKTKIRPQTHNRHPIPRPRGRAMGCVLWGFWRKLTTCWAVCSYHVLYEYDCKWEFMIYWMLQSCYKMIWNVRTLLRQFYQMPERPPTAILSGHVQIL